MKISDKNSKLFYLKSKEKNQNIYNYNAFGFMQKTCN